MDTEAKYWAIGLESKASALRISMEVVPGDSGESASCHALQLMAAPSDWIITSIDRA